MKTSKLISSFDDPSSVFTAFGFLKFGVKFGVKVVALDLKCCVGLSIFRGGSIDASLLSPVLELAIPDDEPLDDGAIVGFPTNKREAS